MNLIICIWIFTYIYLRNRILNSRSILERSYKGFLRKTQRLLHHNHPPPFFHENFIPSSSISFSPSSSVNKRICIDILKKGNAFCPHSLDSIMHCTPLLMIPPRGAKPSFGPIKKRCCNNSRQFPPAPSIRERVFPRVPPLDLGGRTLEENSSRTSVPAKYYVAPSVFRHPLFLSARMKRGKTILPCGEKQQLLDFISGAGTVYLVTDLFFSPSLHFSPSSLPEKGNVLLVGFGSELRISPVCRADFFSCRKSGGKGRDGISEFSWSIERFFFFFFLRGNNVERIWWKIIESDWERGYVKDFLIELGYDFFSHNRLYLIKNYEINCTSNLFD